LLALLAASVLVLAPAGELASTLQDVPASDGWVTDLADLLSPQEERALEALMESYKSGTTHEIALLTVPDLDGGAIEPFALAVARAWGIGGAEASNGALLVVARDDREMRIEVGRGLEGTLTDSIAGRIIRDVIAPEFRRGDYPAGLRRGVEAVHAAIGGDYGPIQTSSGGRRSGAAISGCFGMVFNVVFIVVLLRVFARRRGGRAGVGGGILPWILLSSMSHGQTRQGGFGSGGGGGFSGFGGGGGFSGGGASGGW
jgi:uncharacterized protein